MKPVGVMEVNQLEYVFYYSSIRSAMLQDQESHGGGEDLGTGCDKDVYAHE